MGGTGLTRASEIAILSANYVAHRLDTHFPVLYQNANGRVAMNASSIRDPHRLTGVTVDDIAKRLIDYGFHAPTMSFPVRGTLMIDTDGIRIQARTRSILRRHDRHSYGIREIERQRYRVEDSPLRRAPHTVRDLTADVWARPYSPQPAAFPAADTASTNTGPRGRVDNVYGDRNPFCSVHRWSTTGADAKPPRDSSG